MQSLHWRQTIEGTCLLLIRITSALSIASARTSSMSMTSEQEKSSLLRSPVPLISYTYIIVYTQQGNISKVHRSRRRSVYLLKCKRYIHPDRTCKIMIAGCLKVLSNHTYGIPNRENYLYVLIIESDINLTLKIKAERSLLIAHPMMMCDP